MATKKKAAKAMTHWQQRKAREETHRLAIEELEWMRGQVKAAEDGHKLTMKRLADLMESSALKNAKGNTMRSGIAGVIAQMTQLAEDRTLSPSMGQLINYHLGELVRIKERYERPAPSAGARDECQRDANLGSGTKSVQVAMVAVP